VNFMIIGAMKCGTSSLASMLSEHPEICFSRPKEPDFFLKYTDWESRLHKYDEHFNHKKGRLRGEGSTGYTKLLSTRHNLVQNLYNYNKDLKFIYLVRHPVDRAVSHYLHSYQRGFVLSSFHHSLSRSEILSVGRYYTQLLPYFQLFGKDKILILKFEEYVKDHIKTLEETAAFLGIDPVPFQKMDHIAKNVTRGKKVLSIQQEKYFKKNIRPLRSFIPAWIFKKLRLRLMLLNQERIRRMKLSFSEQDEQKILHYSHMDILQLDEIVPFDLSDYLLPSASGKYVPGTIYHPFRKEGT